MKNEKEQKSMSAYCVREKRRGGQRADDAKKKAEQLGVERGERLSPWKMSKPKVLKKSMRGGRTRRVPEREVRREQASALPPCGSKKRTRKKLEGKGDLKRKVIMTESVDTYGKMKNADGPLQTASKGEKDKREFGAREDRGGHDA